MKTTAMLGCKLVKIKDDNKAHMIRVVGMKSGFKPNRDKHIKAMSVYDYDTNTTEDWKLEQFKDYSILEPDAVMTVSIVTTSDSNTTVKDVIVTGSKYIDIKLSKIPYVVCRQNVTDVFYNLLTQKSYNDIVGMSVSQDTCPVGLDFRIMLAANNLSEYKLINFYRTDTLDDILKLFNHKVYDDVLEDLYNRHCKSSGRMNAIMKKEDKGWCKNLETLLESNAFKNDINQMLGITDVEFDISKYIVEKELPGKDGEKYESISDDLRIWLSSIFKINITDATILKYDHDIDILEFKYSKYFLLRDSSNTMYLVVYNENGEKFAADLDAMDKEYDFSTKFKINFYSKYNNIKKDNIETK